MVMASPTYWTAEMVRALPEDGKRYETVHGELLVTPAPREIHQRVLGRLHLAVAAYVLKHRLGALYLSPADISWGPDVLVQPDMFVVRLEEARTGTWAAMQTLPLAVEIISPSSTRADRFTKRRLYQENGVGTYWCVDPERQEVEVWGPADTMPTTQRARLAWHPAGAPEALVIGVPELFAPL
jgi:Uma2 family endonuclease